MLSGFGGISQLCTKMSWLYHGYVCFMSSLCETTNVFIDAFFVIPNSIFISKDRFN